MSQASLRTLDIQDRSYALPSIRLPEHEVSAKDGIVCISDPTPPTNSPHLHLNSCTAWTKRGGIHVLWLGEQLTIDRRRRPHRHAREPKESYWI